MCFLAPFRDVAVCVRVGACVVIVVAFVLCCVLLSSALCVCDWAWNFVAVSVCVYCDVVLYVSACVCVCDQMALQLLDASLNGFRAYSSLAIPCRVESCVQHLCFACCCGVWSSLRSSLFCCFYFLSSLMFVCLCCCLLRALFLLVLSVRLCCRWCCLCALLVVLCALLSKSSAVSVLCCRYRVVFGYSPCRFVTVLCVCVCVLLASSVLEVAMCVCCWCVCAAPRRVFWVFALALGRDLLLVSVLRLSSCCVHVRVGVCVSLPLVWASACVECFL